MNTILITKYPSLEHVRFAIKVEATGALVHWAENLKVPETQLQVQIMREIKTALESRGL